jgi:hypothetical protein
MEMQRRSTTLSVEEEIRNFKKLTKGKRNEKRKTKLKISKGATVKLL